MQQLPRSKKFTQPSPFLNLPGEIRNQIYQDALVRDQPIDLWPHLWHTNLTGHQAWDNRVSAWSQKLTLDQIPLKVRHQADLLHVRKGMATGLLGTCRQVYIEASPYFWRCNHFRFSGRGGWEGLLRFLLTIGPVARSHLRCLDVHAPIYMRWPEKGDDERDLDGQSKNFPKLHMAKIQDHDQLEDETLQRVCGILAQQHTLQEINFVIPAEFRNGDEDDFGGYPLFQGRLLKLHTLHSFLKVTVVVEKGGYLAVLDGPEQIVAQGWDLKCLPGSYIYEKDPSQEPEHVKHEVTETRTWTSLTRESDQFFGLALLFHEPDQVALPANGGRHKSLHPRPPNLERSLTAFGGCVFSYQPETFRRRFWERCWAPRPDRSVRIIRIYATRGLPSEEWDYLDGIDLLFQEPQGAATGSDKPSIHRGRTGRAKNRKTVRKSRKIGGRQRGIALVSSDC